MRQRKQRRDPKSTKTSKTSIFRVRTARLECLETRICLHDGEDGPWLDHMLDDDAVSQSLATTPMVSALVTAPQAAVPQPSDVGQWGALENWPIECINLVMLPTGKVLGYDRTLNLRLWDPTTNTFTTPASPGYDFFCTGTSLLPDGNLLLVGGAVVDGVGLPYAAIYNPFTDSWNQLGNMNSGRWYPSATTLANGDVVVLSGSTNGNASDLLPEVYDSSTGTWRDLTTAVQGLPLYPRTFSAPNGDAFVAGPQALSEYLDVTGTGNWIPVANRIQPDRNYGSAVMYAPGKVLYVGGGSPASASAEVIDLNQPNPTWRSVSPMAFPRRNCNATLLPDGEVLVVGGNTGSSFVDGDDVMAAEIWNPQTEQFTTLSNMSDIRWYHSTALLLPDGTVLSTSGDNHLTGQVFSPPYLFQGTRPTITSAPGTVQYGQNFFTATPDAASITSARWIRMGSATHAQDWDQYTQAAAFTPSADGTGLNVSAPPTADASPPGYYYLFVLKGNVPSVAKIIKVGTTLPTVSVTGTSATEGPTGTTTNAVFTVSLSLSSAQTVTVAYATADGTASAGTHYTARTGTVTFNPLVTTQTVTVPILNDGVTDPDELFTLNLSAPVGATLDIAQGQGLIRDFNSLPVLQVRGATVIKADAATTDANFVVTLSVPPTTTPVTVAYTTVDGTGKAPHDYIAKSGTLTFNPGVTQQTVVVGVVGNTTDMPNDTFFVKLSNPVGATLDIPQAQGLIYNQSDPTTANLATTATVMEPAPGQVADLVVTVTLSVPSGKTVVVPWTTNPDGSAVIGLNYRDQVGKVTFAPGTTTQTFTVAVLGDGVKTPNETFSILMQSQVGNANYGNRYTLCTIVNSDTVPAISLSNASVTEGNAGTTSAVFTATLSASMAQALTVAYQTSAGTATPNVDYIEAAGTITFAPGTTTQTISVLVNGNTTPQSNRTFNLALNNPVGAMIGAGRSVGTIVDNDGAPVPAAPTNLAVVAGFGSAALTWQASSGTTSYRIYRGTAPNGEGTTPIVTGINGTTFNDSDLLNGTTYYYWVTAVNSPQSGGTYEGSASQEISVTPTSYNFSDGFDGASRISGVVAFADSSTVLSLNGFDVEDVNIFGGNLQLTNGGTNQADSAFTLLPVTVTGFTTQFTFQQGPSYLYTNPLADGMTFTIQRVGPKALGDSGAGLGYAGIANSVAVKFDLFDDAGEGLNSTGLSINGASPTNTSSIDLTGSGIDLHSGHVFSVSMTYDGTTLRVTITDTVTQAAATQSYTVNIPAIIGANTAYVGFTGGTSQLSAVQSIQSWLFTPAPETPTNLAITAASATQVSLSWANTDRNITSVLIERKTGAGGTYAQIGATTSPTANTYTDLTVVSGNTYYYRVRATSSGGSSLASIEVNTASSGTTPTLNFPNGFTGAASQFSFNGSTAKIVGSNLQLTDGGIDEVGSIFALTPVNVSTFNTQFTLQLLAGSTPTADGMTFTIQGVGPTALGSSGGNLGYQGIADSVAVKFDLYDNGGEGPNSTGVYSSGAAPNTAGSISLVGSGIDLHSGHALNVNMNYNGTTLQVTITDSVTLAKATQSYAVTIPAIVGGNMAYVGFTGATGGLTAVQNIQNWTYTPAATVGTPTNLAVTAASATQIGLSWTNTDPSSTSVLIEHKTGVAGTYSQIGATTSPTANTYTDSTVAAGVTYYYRVRASNNGITSAYSNEVNATTSGTTPTLNFPSGFTGAAGQFSFNGASAKIVGSNLQLTDGGAAEGASIFALTSVNVTTFNTQFTVQLLAGTTPTADGMTFTIQGVGPTALGGTGGNLGFAGIANSVAVKFDLFDNAGEGSNSTGLYTNGAAPNATNSINLTGTGIDLHSGHAMNVSMTYNGTTLQVTITDSVTHATATQSYTVNIPTIVGGNTAYAGFTGATGGLTAVQNIQNWTYSQVGSTDLRITNTDGQTSAVPGAPITYTIVVTNAGPSNVTGATVADTFPAALTSLTYTATATGNATGFTASGSGSINNTVNMPSGSTITYVVLATLSSSATGTLADTATVTAPTGVTDTNLANNSAADSDTLTPQADLRITNTDGQTSAVPGAPITYTIVVTNAGPSNVTGATVADTFPAALTSLTYTATATGNATGFTASGSGSINNTVNMPSGSTITYFVLATLSSSATGSVADTATVTAPAGVTDANLANNSAADSDTLTPQADLRITNTDGQTRRRCLRRSRTRSWSPMRAWSNVTGATVTTHSRPL